MQSRDHELTARAFALGIALTLVLTAANVYLGLKAGLTFATSIPAAVISMALFSALGRTNARENNIVQIIASAAGAQASIIFVLPAFVMGGALAGFPFWPMLALTAASGVLGVVFTVPLRRAMVVDSDLPYPEGVAAAEILRLADPGAPGRSGLDIAAGTRALIEGAAISAVFPLLVGIKLFAEEITAYARVGGAVTGFGVSYSLALIGAGYLIGIVGTIGILAGVVIGFGIAVPVLASLSAHDPSLSAAALAHQVARGPVRLFGVGAIAVASLWTVATLLGPVARGVRTSLARRAPATATGADDRDLPPGLLGALTAGAMLVLAYVVATLAPDALGLPLWALVVGAVLLAVILGAVVAAASGYMAGLVGSSASPISSTGLLAVIVASFALLAVTQPDARAGAIVVALTVTAAVLGAASNSNDNLQDLKTGHLLGATPWKQQVALLVGVIAAAPVVSPVLAQLYQAYGFAGHTLPGQDEAHALAAPQGALMLATATGILERNLDWNLVGAGAALGAVLIVLDRALRRRGLALPPLAVALGIYLPLETNAPLIIGGLVGWAARRRLRARGAAPGAEQIGVLAASGLIVGESLIGVVTAFLVGATGTSEPLALLPEGFATVAAVLGAAGFVAAMAWLYRVGAGGQKPKLRRVSR